MPGPLTARAFVFRHAAGVLAMNEPITDAFRISNEIEGVFWMLVGGLAFKAARDRALPRLAWAYLATLVVFGVSDWVESTTGAWWRPWWLFAWKAGCVTGLLGMTVAASVLVRRRGTPSA